MEKVDDIRKRLSPFNLVEDTSFHRAWQRAAAFIDESGVSRIIGGPKEENGRIIIERKPARDTCQLIILTGPALSQMKESEMHPAFPFGPKQLEEYCKQFTPEYVKYWQSLPLGDSHRFRYLYFERMIFPFNQLKAMKENLAEQIEDGISSNRTQLTTWRPAEDAFNDEPPCLQRVQIIYLGEDSEGLRYIEIRYDWRSRDINAWQSNKIALNRAIRREVLDPNNCEVLRDIDYCASLHCYEDRMPALHTAAHYHRTGNTFFVI